MKFKTLIEELRSNQYIEQGAAHDAWDLFNRAADEIERLENEVYELNSQIGDMNAGYY